MRRPGGLHRALALVAALALAGGPSFAQTQAPTPSPTAKPQRPGPPPPPAAPPPPPQPAPPPDPNAPPPYEAQLMRLAEVLGALHHLRTVCKERDAEVWRDRLAALIEADAMSPDRRERLAGAFNASFRTWARSYRSCTPSAVAASRMYLDEAAKIAGAVKARYAP